MFSRPNHYHQDGPAPCLAPPLQLTTHCGSSTAGDHLLAHHQHLESLLDSALATLALIQNSEPPTAPPVYTPHLLGVLRILHSQITSQATVTTPPPSTTPSTKPDPAAPATYAAAVDHRCTASSSAPELNTLKHPIADVAPTKPPRVVHPPAAERPARVIIRFDKGPAQPKKTNPPILYEAITKSLLYLFEKTPNHPKSVLAGVQWTKNGNLVLHPAVESCTAQFLVAQSETIWTTIRELLRLSDDHKCPIFDTDERWHSVVFHGVPKPAAHADVFTHELVEPWVTSAGKLRECSVLCRPEDFQKRTTLSLRVSLSSEADATRLIKNGGYMFGVPCRVSHYVPKPRSPPSTPQP
ncbi:hypothetical protein B0H13DRAFT_1878968 [Mycena leptocephala]|nr:hypothetical protein B0H13DRAFT_1878968 [Mycena leptocephala]